jgi:hypothetical protein
VQEPDPKDALRTSNAESNPSSIFVGTSQSRLQQVENATDNIKALRLERGQTVADLTQEFGNLVDVRDDCSNEPLTSEHKGFYFMEIMRNAVDQGGIEREFSTALQSLDITPGQRKRYEGIVSTFKAADEPQTKALAKERLKTGSSKQTPEGMHAMDVEDGGITECRSCTSQVRKG